MVRHLDQYFPGMLDTSSMLNPSTTDSCSQWLKSNCGMMTGLPSAPALQAESGVC